MLAPRLGWRCTARLADGGTRLKGRYERGHVPALGAILVFKRTRQIPSGHVAVVARIVNAHEIRVDHANWHHGTVSRGMSVIDTSPSHDWTSVAVMNPPSGTQFNFFSYWDLPGGLLADIRMQAHSVHPITDNPLGTGTGPACSENNSLTRIVNGVDCGHLRKNNEFFSFDWRLQRPFKLNERYAIVPQIEMFNTFNNTNNVNPLVSPGLFNFDGFLCQGVGDPRQAQLSVKFTFRPEVSRRIFWRTFPEKSEMLTILLLFLCC